jgi:cysteine desulfurase
MKAYLDNNATTPLAPEVQKAITDSLSVYGNPSSAHAFGVEARALVEQSREDVAKLLGVPADEIIFTSGGSESNNLVIKGTLCHSSSCVFAEKIGKPHVITSVIEHPAVLESCRCLEHEGAEVTFLPVDGEGRVSPDDLEKAIKPTTKLITIMYANNEIGTIQPIPELAQVARNHGVRFHTDAVQAVGKIPVDPIAENVDFLSLSGHKLNGPKGVGALWFRNKMYVCPLITGGHQERGQRAGTENTLGIVGLGAAAKLALSDREDEAKRVAALRDRLQGLLVDSIPDTRINGSEKHRLPNTLNISFKYIEGESILYYLDFEDIAVSTGSACSSGSLEPSHVLLALGLDHGLAHGSVRFSLGRYTTEEEINYTAEKVKEVVERLRAMSPLC